MRAELPIREVSVKLQTKSPSVKKTEGHILRSKWLAEGVGFEPTVLAHNGFQDRLYRPLRHPSLRVFEAKIRLLKFFCRVFLRFGHGLVTDAVSSALIITYVKSFVKTFGR
jgi:hypothetical protein